MFYERLKIACKAKGITASALAREAGLTTANTSKWKHGGMPSVEVLLKFAERLETTTDYLLGRMDATNPKETQGKKKEPALRLSENQKECIRMDFSGKVITPSGHEYAISLTKEGYGEALAYLINMSRNNPKVEGMEELFGAENPSLQVMANAAMANGIPEDMVKMHLEHFNMRMEHGTPHYLTEEGNIRYDTFIDGAIPVSAGVFESKPRFPYIENRVLELLRQFDSEADQLHILTQLTHVVEAYKSNVKAKTGTDG